MAQRPQVQNLQTKTVVAPTATNVVDTYVRPTEQPTQASPLSQFVAAISPAVQQFSEEKRVEKLKREQEEENLLKLRKQKQIENQLVIASKQIENSLINDSEVWNSLDAGAASDKINSHFSSYISKLEDSNVDRLYIERAKIASENAATALFMSYDTNKKTHQIEVDNEDFISVLSLYNNTNIVGKTPEEQAALEQAQIKLIQDHITSSANAFPTSDGKPDFRRFVDLAHQYQVDIASDTADTLLYAALETMKKEDGTPANVMDTLERAAGTAKIRSRVDSERAGLVIAQAKGIAVSKAVDAVFATQSSSPMNNVQHANKSGGTSTVSTQEMEQAVLTDTRFTSLPAGDQYAFLAKTGITPTVMKNTVNDFVQLMTSGADITTEEEILKLERGFITWEAMVGSGMNVDFINEDDMYRLKAMRYFLLQKANVGEVSVTQERSVTVAGIPEIDLTQRTIKDYGAAALMAREIKMDYDISAKELGTIADVLSDMTWFATNHKDTFNSHQVVKDVAFGAKALYRTGNYATVEDAIADAAQIANDDYHIVESGDGTKYSFMSLSTDMEKTSELVQYVNEANQSIQTKIAPEMKKRFSLAEDGYVVAVTPHPTNPKALRLEAWIKDGDSYSYFRPLVNQFDKQKFLTDPSYLNKLLVNIEQEEAPSLLITDNNTSDELNASVNEVPNVNFFGGSIGRPRPAEPADIGAMPFLSGDAWLQQLSEIANTARLTTDSNPILNWLNENPPLFDVDGKQSVFNQALDIVVEAAKGDKFEKKEIDNSLTRLFDATSDTTQEALDAVTGMIENAKTRSVDTKPMPNIFKEFPATKAFEGIGQEIKDVISSLGISKANAATTIISDEGFSNVQYDDMGKNSVGHGLQVESLEADERALIKDINNVQPDESAAVVALKVDKIDNYFSNVVEDFENLPDKARSSVIQMGYQLGQFNVTKEWPKFMASIKEAAKATQGSVEQAAALAEAKFNMLYNVAEDGVITASKWSTQTADRAMRVAEGMVTDAGELLSETGEVIGDNLQAAGGAIVNAIIPSAEASDLKPAIIGEEPEAEAVAAIAGAKNPADAAYAYLGMSENTEDGARAVKGFFENVVGNWNPDDQSVEEFATSKAWCAAFLTQVLRDSGVDTKSLLGTDKFNQVRAASYLKAGDAIDASQAQAGDIMIKMHSAEDRKKYKLGVAHVGVVAKIEGDTVYFIGGNTGDKVELSDFNMTEKDVRFRRIKGVTDIPTQSLPSMLQLKAGKLGRKSVDKLTNGFNSLYEMAFGD